VKFWTGEDDYQQGGGRPDPYGCFEQPQCTIGGEVEVLEYQHQWSAARARLDHIAPGAKQLVSTFIHAKAGVGGREKQLRDSLRPFDPQLT
jgi:hypothetical protein